MKKYNVVIFGASGVVGRSILKELDKRDFPVNNIKLVASSRSAGKVLEFKDQKLIIEEVNSNSFNNADIIFGATTNEITLKYIDDIRKSKALFIDNSSTFRMDDDVPLVVAGVNDEDIFKNKGIIANPNCSTIIGMMVIAPLHKKYQVESMIVSTYQAVSGAGEMGMLEYEEELKAIANNREYEAKAFSHQIVSNLIPQIGDFLDNDYTSEEMKFQNEGRKILHDPNLKVSSTCVRVPVLRSHSLSIFVKMKKDFTKEDVINVLKTSKGIKYLDDKNPMPLYLEDGGIVEVGRLRLDIAFDKALSLWCVGDQILKGAALNAIEIAEIYIRG